MHFDCDNVLLDGAYGDELSLYRARRVWADVLEANFLLEKGYDFDLKVESKADDKRFVLTCKFTSSCGRYAFWRLINNQAPEAQYLIESAHIPPTESQSEKTRCVPDMQPKDLVENEVQASIVQRVRELMVILRRDAQ